MRLSEARDALAAIRLSIPRRRPGPSWGTFVTGVAYGYISLPNWAPAFAGEAYTSLVPVPPRARFNAHRSTVRCRIHGRCSDRSPSARYRPHVGTCLSCSFRATDQVGVAEKSATAARIDELAFASCRFCSFSAPNNRAAGEDDGGHEQYPVGSAGDLGVRDRLCRGDGRGAAPSADVPDGPEHGLPPCRHADGLGHDLRHVPDRRRRDRRRLGLAAA